MYRFGKDVIRFILAVYHKLLSPFLPRSCRFFPSCSVYAAEAIRKHGILRGLSLGAKRIGRCHPWNPGGHDPVH